MYKHTYTNKLKDKEFFDYTECDKDAYLDDLEILDRDAQDAYFSGDDMHDSSPARLRPSNRSEAIKRFQQATKGGLAQNPGDVVAVAALREEEDAEMGVEYDY
eukprot:CAMPEP_0179422358 /NCGR_PEP_ID=MMETSP0799-20121207/10382_1 /TAXON_ID=46947 /ORGANISM="Geminigera cryophila, Strain CCMP2564" /LENGTH=102 /DNA_ID=CAMNT_0021196477 /DNA_START=285 /DNA_END=594 /DNA_ORIENTATION=+